MESLHPEQAAILAVGRREFMADCDLVVAKVKDESLLPMKAPSCVYCSKLILAAGLQGVWVLHEHGWHRYSAIEFHAACIKGNRARLAGKQMRKGVAA